jgi:hypothetical protein
MLQNEIAISVKELKNLIKTFLFFTRVEHSLSGP